MGNTLLHNLVSETSEKYPENIAVTLGDDYISYQVLVEKSNALANHLIETGFSPHDVACVYLDKSIEAIVAFIAVLKAGGVYVPLDSMYTPPERIKTIIRQSNTDYVITDMRHAASLKAEPFSGHGKVLLLDGMLKNKKPASPHLCDCVLQGADVFYFDSSIFFENVLKNPGITKQDLAYILYTSGSTGQPKGVMISHSNAMAFVNWAVSCFNPGPDDIFANHAPLHFDLSVFDIYAAIATGGRIALVSPGISGNPRALVQWMAAQKITYWYSVPSVWISILNYAHIDSKVLDTLGTILFAGEVFPPNYLKRLMAALPDASYYNLYGPTETNVCTFHHVEHPNEITDRPVPIGKPCSDTTVLVLNNENEPAGMNETGELLVTGPTVFQGYHNNTEMTETAFYTDDQNKKFYKTGDIVRKTGADQYDYIGRKDLMVKCSGFRVELQEIEHALYQLDTVIEAVVVPFFLPERGSFSLNAYVRMDNNKAFSVMNIKKNLAGVLPNYMIPEIIEKADEIPKNSNGKVDRQRISKWPLQAQAR